MLKSGTTSALLELLAPIQAEFRASAEWQKIEKQAYPPPEVKKKEKKVKDKGSRYPGGAASKTAEAKPDGHIEGSEKDQVNLTSSAEAAIKNLEVKE